MGEWAGGADFDGVRTADHAAACKRAHRDVLGVAVAVSGRVAEWGVRTRVQCKAVRNS